VVFGACGAAGEIIARIAAEMETDLSVFATGGNAKLVESCLPQDWEVAPLLTFEGLEIAFRQAF
jgi:pantothenate kinase type III